VHRETTGAVDRGATFREGRSDPLSYFLFNLPRPFCAIAIERLN
jgi:hypothetical protein